jgi:hypothetical protein
VKPDKKPLKDASALRRFADRRPRRLQTLAALALAAAVIFAIGYAIRPAEAPEPPDTRVALIVREKTSLDSITIALRGEEPYTLNNLNDYDLSDANDVLGREYEVVGRGDFAVSTARVMPMERYATDLLAADTAAVSADDLAQYGLVQPAIRVVIGYRDGTGEALDFGDPTPAGNGFYLRREGDPAVYVASPLVYDAFFRSMDELEQSDEEKAEYAAIAAQKDAARQTPTPAP